MKVKTSNVLPILAIFVLFLLGAQFEGCSQRQQQEHVVYGLSFDFVYNAPPEEIQVNQHFPVYVDVYNKGGYDLQAGAGSFYLLGIGNNLKNINTKLTNAHVLTAETGFERLVFSSDAYSDLTLSNTFSFPIQLIACYSYATITQASICVAKQEGVCSFSDVVFNNINSSIQVASITEEVKGNTLYVYIDIVNKANGDVFMPESDCDKVVENDINEMLKKGKFKVTIQAEQGFVCSLEDGMGNSIESLQGYARLGRITCKKNVANEQAHMSNFMIVTEYKYVDSKKKTLTLLP